MPSSCTTKQQIRRRLSSWRPSVVTMAGTNKSLAQMNKPSDVDKATKKYSASTRCKQGGKGRILLRSVLPTCPGLQWWLGLFPSLAATNKFLAQRSKPQGGCRRLSKKCTLDERTP